MEYEVMTMLVDLWKHKHWGLFLLLGIFFYPRLLKSLQNSFLTLWRHLKVVAKWIWIFICCFYYGYWFFRRLYLSVEKVYDCVNGGRLDRMEDMLKGLLERFDKLERVVNRKGKSRRDDKCSEVINKG